MSLRRAAFSFLFLVAAAATTSTARADFSLFVIDSANNNFIEIMDGGLGDTDGMVNGSITGDVNLVEAIIGGDFRFTALGGKSNSPGSGNTAFLTQTYEVSGSGTLSIVAAANDYFLGPNVNLAVTSQGTSNFGATGSGTASFFSSVDDANTPPQMTSVGVATAVLFFASPGVMAKANGEVVPVMGSFALFNESTFTLQGTSLQFTGRTDVVGTAVPEPASMAMLAVGGLGVMGAARRRRKAQA